MQHVFIIGSKGIPANYGGFETFVENLTARKKSENVVYHIACVGEQEEEFYYNHSHCFKIKTPNIGSAKAIYYDIKSFEYCLKYIKANKIKDPIVYVLACRIGPFILPLKKELCALNGKLYVNPDGHEWKRSKWPKPVQRYWKLSEKLMIKYADLVICDSRKIEKYIKADYEMYKPKTTYIAYGAQINHHFSEETIKDYEKWCMENGVKKGQYYLVVGRFVPENNYESIINEFMKSKVNKSLVLITNKEHNRFYTYLQKKTGFEQDLRIKFVSAVYNQELLQKIRVDAFGYLHGHEVGGTNPSLLEALASTKLNLLYHVSFNREVGGKSAQYWTKEEGMLSELLNENEMLSTKQIEEYETYAKERLEKHYSWDAIVASYEKLFEKNCTEDGE